MVNFKSSNLDQTINNLNSVFPIKHYNTSGGTYVPINNLVTSQIAIVRIDNDRSDKTPTGNDGVLIVFGDSVASVQLFFDWNSTFKRRIMWGGTWRNWI